MAVVFRPTLSRRERILAVGKESSGKSYAMMTVIKRVLSREDATEHFYIIDNDNAWELLLESAGLLDHPNIHLIQAYEWPELRDAMKSTFRKVERNDWLVVDFYDKARELCKDYFVEVIHGADPTDYYMKLGLDGEDKLLGGDMSKTWDKINSTMGPAWWNPILQVKGHVFCTAEPKPINPQFDGPDIKALYGEFDAKPGGGPRIGHLFHSVILFRHSIVGRQITTMGKDREREFLKNKKWKDFSEDYLAAVAGWKMGVEA